MCSNVNCLKGSFTWLPFHILNLIAFRCQKVTRGSGAIRMRTAVCASLFAYFLACMFLTVLLRFSHAAFSMLSSVLLGLRLAPGLPCTYIQIERNQKQQIGRDDVKLIVRELPRSRTL